MSRDFDECATTQKAIIDILERSPLPWTHGMILGYFGRVDSNLTSALGSRRIRRMGPNLYTAASKYESPVVTVSSAYLKRKYGIYA